MEHKVFVYGTLKQGQSNHRLLEGAKFVGKAITIRPFLMLDNGGFPVVLDPNDADTRRLVAGEVYEVDSQTLSHLDRLEGHPSWYCRQEIVVDYADRESNDTVWMYVGTPKGWGNAPKHLPEAKANATGIYSWARN